MQLRNLHSDQIISDDVGIAANFTSRFFGLMGKRTMELKKCLWITRCNSVHTCFMNFAIDVVFLDQDMKVVAIKEKVKPWKFTWPVIGAKSVLEFYEQNIGTKMKLGDQLHVGN
ncbi:MAG: DUF192 domain-containing protein [Bdellovibrionales bacterium]|nr:DUF192 domain-containing protein [Bdellovibrionales bacterium]